MVSGSYPGTEGVLIAVATLLHPSRRDGHHDHRQRGGADRRTFSLHPCLVAGLARPTRTLCVSSSLAQPALRERPEIGWLFDVANDVGGAGMWALALAAVATAVVAVRDGGRRALPGGVLLVISSGYFAIAGLHIYWPRGVLTMLVMALAFGWVA